QCQIGKGEYSEANELLQRAISSDPARLNAYSRLAVLMHRQLKNTAGALSLLDRMVAANGDNHRAYLVRGSFLLDDLKSLAAESVSKDDSSNPAALTDAAVPPTAPANEAQHVD